MTVGSSDRDHVVVIGAGIVGPAVAHELTKRGDPVSVIHKEGSVAAHQTGRNSGVIHSVLYYKRGAVPCPGGGSPRSFGRLSPPSRRPASPRHPRGSAPQALDRKGRLIDDFHYVRTNRQVHVLNAPSPAATASLEIGRHITDELLAHG